MACKSIAGQITDATNLKYMETMKVSQISLTSLHPLAVVLAKCTQLLEHPARAERIGYETIIAPKPIRNLRVRWP